MEQLFLHLTFIIFGFWILYLSEKASSNIFIFLLTYVIYYLVELIDNNSGRLIINNFYPNDYFGFFIVFVLIIKFLKGHYRFLYKKTIFKIFLIYYITELIIVIFSIKNYGLFSISRHRPTLHAYNMLFVLIGYNYDKKSLLLFIKSLRLIAICIIFAYLLKLSGLLDIYHNYQEMSYYVEYVQVRYLSNIDVLYLLLYYIYYRKSKDYEIQMSKFDNILSFISIFLIITSTQRMITLLFLMFLVYEYFFNKQTRIISKYAYILIILISLPIIFNIIPEKNKNAIINSFENIFNKDTFIQSTAYYKLMDPYISTVQVINNKQWLFGRLIQKELFERSYLDFVSTEERFVHNLFVLSFVEGGLIKTIPLLILWIYLLLSLSRYFSLREKKDFYKELAFIWLFILMLFNNTSGVTHINSFFIGYSIIALNVNKKEIVKNSQDQL